MGTYIDVLSTLFLDIVHTLCPGKERFRRIVVFAGSSRVVRIRSCLSGAVCPARLGVNHLYLIRGFFYNRRPMFSSVIPILLCL